MSDQSDSTPVTPPPDPEPEHVEPTPLEREIFPSWFLEDPAADEPNYMGYIVSTLLVALILVLVAMAVIVTW